MQKVFYVSVFVLKTDYFVESPQSRAKSLEGLVSEVVFGGLCNVVVENNSGRIFFAWRVAKVARLWRVTKGGGWVTWPRCVMK